MGLIQFSYLRVNRAGAIKRVVRNGPTFVCGLCRSRFSHEGMALGCVESCWRDVLSLDPVIVKARPARVLYRCRFCARDHEMRNTAVECAADCRDRNQVSFRAEGTLLDAVEVVVRARPKRQRPAAMRSVPQREKGSKPPTFAGETTIAVQSAAENGNSSAAATEPGPTSAPLAAELASGPKKPKPSKMFYRDQAKYVCTVCNAKYFTKDEVSKCFEAHP